jgi:hypothetical protein
MSRTTGKRFAAAAAAILLLVLTASSYAAELSSDVQKQVDAKIATLKVLAADPVVVAAVRQHNDAPQQQGATMTNEKWKGLALLDPFVRSLTKNSLANFLKEKKDEAVSEVFVSGASGSKVAFLMKTTSWSHAGSAKHEQPMHGKIWIGPIELDESTGMQQIQVAIPVLDSGKPIGSMVFGLSRAKLK